jgi:hypothetical protein
MDQPLRALTKSILAAFPDALALIHWGGSHMRGKASPAGDVDILIVLPDGGAMNPRDLFLLKSKNKSPELDPYAIRRADLKKKTLVATGPHGPYEMHELIHYQIKNESEVIYGDKGILKLIRPMPLKKALAEILPHVRDAMLPKLAQALDAKTRKQFLDENLGVLLVVVRCIYSVDRGGLATKEAALGHMAARYPRLLPSPACCCASTCVKIRAFTGRRRRMCGGCSPSPARSSFPVNPCPARMRGKWGAHDHRRPVLRRQAPQAKPGKRASS